MRFDFDTIPNRRQSDSVKWNRYPEDVLPMWVADMDFSSPPAVIAALHERVEHGVFGYPIEFPEAEDVLPDQGKDSPLREVILSYLWEKHNCRVTSEQLIVIPGVVTGLNMAAQMVALKQDSKGGVLTQPPVYGPILGAPKNANLPHLRAPLEQLPDGTYEVDWDAFEEAAKEAGVFILCNPHNPTGRVFRKDELARMAEICLREDVLICSDEIHCDLLYSGQKHIPIAALSPEVMANTITLMAPTKAFNLPGLHCSFAIVPTREMRVKFCQAKMGMVGFVTVLGQAAMEAAYRKGGEWLEDLLTYLEENREFTYRFVQERLPGISMARPEGTYLAWLDCQEAQLPVSPDRFFLEHAKVALTEGTFFGAEGEGFVRLNFGTSRAVLKEGLNRMEHAILEKSG